MNPQDNTSYMLLVLPGLFPVHHHDLFKEVLMHESLAWFIERSSSVLDVSIPSYSDHIPSLMGLNPELYPLRHGPMMISNMGMKPPSDSDCFKLSLGHIQDDRVSFSRTHSPEYNICSEEAEYLETLFLKLKTKRMSPLFYKGLEHALVIENSKGVWDTYEPEYGKDKSLYEVLPKGDEERLLRNFVQDSINALDETEWNKKRKDEGILPLNLLWPWGQGKLNAYPFLALRYGYVPDFCTNDVNLNGMARLVGFRSTHRDFRRSEFEGFLLESYHKAMTLDNQVLYFRFMEEDAKKGREDIFLNSMQAIHSFIFKVREDLLEGRLCLGFVDPYSIAVENRGLFDQHPRLSIYDKTLNRELRKSNLFEWMSKWIAI